jgi:uncharacterized metal-binding protein
LGHCKAGEDWSSAAIENQQIPVLSCEGPCVKGEIARRTAGLLPDIDSRFKRACHGESFYVPHSAMAKWVKESPAIVMIDGCFLACHGRILENIVDPQKIVHINAHGIHRKYGDDFSMDNIPEYEFTKLTSQVAKTILTMFPEAKC